MCPPRPALAHQRQGDHGHRANRPDRARSEPLTLLRRRRGPIAHRDLDHPQADVTRWGNHLQRPTAATVGHAKAQQHLRGQVGADHVQLGTAPEADLAKKAEAVVPTATIDALRD